MPEAPVVLYERRGPVAYVTMNRPRYRNAQNSAMTYALDDAFYRAADDPEVKVVVLAGPGSTSPRATTSAPPSATPTSPSSGGPACGGTTAAGRAPTPASRASRRCTWACADAGGSCRSR